MPNPSAERFRFIGYALSADGPFRPRVTEDGTRIATLSGLSYLVRYPRESDVKFARRNEVAFYASPLLRACARFTGYLSTKPPQRQMPNPLFESVAADVDGKGNDIDVFLQQFALDAKARGSMLMLVDMPSDMPATRAEQMSSRRLPYWSAIKPESVTDYAVGEDGQFEFVEFAGTFAKDGAQAVDCAWRFDRQGWTATDKERRTLSQGQHPLGRCPVIIFTEGGDFPHFGPFAAIADVGKRLFNADSELDEILRSQTFSLLTMQVPEESTDGEKIQAAQVAGETIGTNNLMVHSGSTPAFIAPPDGPARIYLDRIKQLQSQVDEIGLNVIGSMAQESGIALQMRFQALNGELSKFAGRMEDFEKRAWELSRAWLGMTQAPTVEWPRDYNLSDVQTELQILADMQASGMPRQVIAQQQKRVVALQFPGLEQMQADEIAQAIDEPVLEQASLNVERN